MEQSNLNTLRDDLKGLQEEAQEFVAKVESGEVPTQEELTRSEAVESEIDSIKTKIEALERSERLRSLYGKKEGNKPTAPVVKVSRQPTKADHYNVFKAWLCNDAENATVLESWKRSADLLGVNYQSSEYIVRDMTTDVVGEGGYFLNDSTFKGLVDAEAYLSDIERISNVIPQADGGVFHWVTQDDTDATNNATPSVQATQLSASVDLPVTRVQISTTSYKTAVFPVSYEALEDAPGIVDWVFQKLARRLNAAKQADLVDGDGTNKCRGFLRESTQGSVGYSNNLTEADILDLYFSVDRHYRANGTWVMNDATFAHLLSIRDEESGERILGLGLNEGPSLNMLGRPILIVPDMPTMAAGQERTPIAFGDFSNFFIRQGAVRLRKDESRYVDYLSVGVFAYQRLGSKLIDAGTNPVKHLTTGTLSGDA